MVAPSDAEEELCLAPEGEAARNLRDAGLVVVGSEEERVEEAGSENDQRQSARELGGVKGLKTEFASHVDPKPGEHVPEVVGFVEVGGEVVDVGRGFEARDRARIKLIFL